MFSLRNILYAVLAALILAAGWGIYNNIKDSGRNEVKQEVQAQNQKLDENVRNVNENVTRNVITETHTIERRSREVEEVINAQPREALSSVSRARLERVREQQQSVPEAGSKTE